MNVGSASADYPFSFVEITCAPEIHFAAVRRFWVYNLPDGGRYLDDKGFPLANARTTVEHNRHIFTSRALAAHPETCEIPAHAPQRGEARPGFVLRVTAQVDINSMESSYRRTRDQVEVTAFGEPLASFGMNPYGVSHGADSVEISADGVGFMIRKCTMSEEDETELTCKRTYRPTP